MFTLLKLLHVLSAIWLLAGLLARPALAGAITDRRRPFLQREAMIRRYAPDIVGVLVIVVLMVTKPF